MIHWVKVRFNIVRVRGWVMSRRGTAIWIRQGRRRIIVSTQRKNEKNNLVHIVTSPWISSKGQGGMAQIKVIKLG
jgi:hypothetical protein